MILVLSNLNKLDTAIEGTKQFSNPQALSSAFVALGTHRPRAFGLLNYLVPLILVPNYYLVQPMCANKLLMCTHVLILIAMVSTLWKTYCICYHLSEQGKLIILECIIEASLALREASQKF